MADSTRHRAGRFSMVPARALDDTRMTPQLYRMLGLLANYGNRHGWAQARQKLMANRIGVTQQAVSKAILILVDLGYAELKQSFGPDGRRLANLYRVLYDTELPPEFDRWHEAWGEEEPDPIYEPPITAEEDPDFGGGYVSDSAPLTTPGVAPPTTPGVVTPTTPGVVAVSKTLESGLKPNPPLYEKSLQPALRVMTGGAETSFDTADRLARVYLAWLVKAGRPKPSVSHAKIRVLAKHALERGWTETAIAEALEQTNVWTTGGLELALNTVDRAPLGLPREAPSGPSQPLYGRPGVDPACEACEGGWATVLDGGGNLVAVPCPNGCRP